MISLILLAVLCVFAFSLIAAAFLPHKVLSEETAKLAGISLGAAVFISIIVGLIAKYAMTGFNELWHFKISEVRYYEDWDERVPCVHAKYETRTRTVTDSQGRTQTETYLEFVGYQHAYDVDYHPEYWTTVCEYGNERSLDKKDYRHWVRIWGNEQFVELHRDYHSNDGDMYRAHWNGDFDKMYPFAERHTYENRVRASNSVFNFGTPDPKIEEAFPRPADTDDFSPIKGFGIAVGHWDMPDQLLIRRVNALLAPTHEVSNFIYVFNAREYSDDIVGQINTAWKGPNKNELITFIGIDPDSKKVQWCQVLSWCDDTTIHAVLRQKVFEAGVYSPETLADIIREVVPKYWKRKEFADFAYIEVDTPMAAYAIVAIITLGAVGITSFGLGLYEHREYGYRYKPYNRPTWGEWRPRIEKRMAI